MTALTNIGDPAGLMAGRIICQWLMIAALLLVLGLAAFAVAAGRASEDFHAWPPWFLAVVRLAALMQLAMLPVILVIDVAGMAQVDLGSAIPLIPEVLHETHFGHIWISLAPLALLLVLAAWVPAHRDSVRGGCLAVIAGAQLLLWAAASHAGDHGWVAVAVYFIHEAAAGLWFGALVGLWLVADLGEHVVRSAAFRTSRVSGWCVVTLILTGAYSSYIVLGLNLHRIFYSSYGITLLGKVAVFAVVLAVGGYNRRWLLPALDAASKRQALVRNSALESVLLIGVLGLAALLSNTAPPPGRVAILAGHANVALAGCGQQRGGSALKFGFDQYEPVVAEKHRIVDEDRR